MQCDQAEELCMKGVERTAVLEDELRAAREEIARLAAKARAGSPDSSDAEKMSLQSGHRYLNDFAAFADTVSSLQTLLPADAPNAEHLSELVEQLKAALQCAETQRNQAEEVCLVQVQEAEAEIKTLRASLHEATSARRESEARVERYEQTMVQHNVPLPSSVPGEDLNPLQGFTAFDSAPTSPATAGDAALDAVRAERDAAREEIWVLVRDLRLAESQRDQAEQLCILQAEQTEEEIASLRAALRAAPQPVALPVPAASAFGQTTAAPEPTDAADDDAVQFDELVGFKAFGGSASHSSMADYLDNSAARLAAQALPPSTRSAEQQEALETLRGEVVRHK
eukprot:TRINITY_DN3482_c0_g1_i3.p1 TRINITY_DN3482_c0_g1~~TRINITY_DN3482_c0_g1_i3.p1  ORF type:complete len:340 (+),score=107.83 TRINITY_DN3482_c0_g1_i3:239-1258(+)